MTYQERVRAARQADIAEICRKMGVEIVPENRQDEYRVKGYGGLLINRNGYYCHSNPGGRLDSQPEGEENNAISFVMYFFGVSFRDALDLILGDGYNAYTRHTAAAHYAPQPSKPAEIKHHPTKSADYRHVMAYLTKTRCIPAEVVRECIDRGLLFEDDHRNAVFVCRDDLGQIIGYEIKGTNTNSEKIYKRSEGNAAFRLVCGRKPTGVIAFESAIDLLSYYAIYQQKLTHHLLLSMAGCRPEILEQIMATHPDYQIGIATDLDDRGKKFFANYSSAHPDYRITRVPPTGCKDWNDVIRKLSGRK